MVTQVALWQAINAFEMDAAEAAFPFSRRLARDNGWSQKFALSAIADYKRFIYLICVSGSMLTPSDVIDEVWHLHLIYSENYWERFCGETLKRKIHHGPTKGGQTEANTYLSAYQHTLALYQKEFETPPPPELWPDVETRFDRPKQLQRIDISEKIILPKRQVFLCLSLALPLLLAGCEMQCSPSTEKISLWTGLCAALFLSVLNLTKIRQHGLALYILGLLTFVPAFGLLCLGLIYRLFEKFAGHEPRPGTSIFIASLIATLLWIWLYTAPRKNKMRGDGNGCSGSGCGSSDGGHGSGGHGSGGHGCGGHGCGGGCGGH